MEDKTPFSHILSEATRVVGLMGEVAAVVFLFGWMDIGAKKKFERNCKIEKKEEKDCKFE